MTRREQVKGKVEARIHQPRPSTEEGALFVSLQMYGLTPGGCWETRG